MKKLLIIVGAAIVFDISLGVLLFPTAQRWLNDPSAEISRVRNSTLGREGMELLKSQFMDACILRVAEIVNDVTKSDQIRYTCYCSMEKAASRMSGKNISEINEVMDDLKNDADRIVLECARQVGLVPAPAPR